MLNLYPNANCGACPIPHMVALIEISIYIQFLAQIARYQNRLSEIREIKIRFHDFDISLRLLYANPHIKLVKFIIPMTKSLR